jgi:hypothetical protein
MRMPSKVSNAVNEESLKSIKSTDSKKMTPLLHKLQEEPQEDSSSHQSNIRLSEDEIRLNRKITDYFPFKKVGQTTGIASPIQQNTRQPNNNLSQSTRSPLSPESVKCRGSGD